MKLKHIILVATILLPLAVLGLGNTSYSLISVSSDKTYYNLFQFENRLYIGSSQGAIIVDKSKRSEKIDEELKGYLTPTNQKVTSNTFHFGHIILAEENRFNYLLPDSFKKRVSLHNIYGDKLYIINSGKLFIFEKYNYAVSHDSLSIRSISQNYIGSYSGIFKNGIKQVFPLYTDGYIREMPNETFICYEGLFRDSSGVKTVYANAKKEVQIGNSILGSAINIEKVSPIEYALATTSGIYLVNFVTKKVDVILSNKFVTNYNIIKVGDVQQNNAGIYFTAGNKLYYYFMGRKELVLLLDSKHEKEIRQAYFPNTIDKIYVLFEDKLSLFTLEAKNKNYSEKILIDNLLYCHNFVLFNEKIFITSNEGSHIYDLKTNKAYLKTIPIEANNHSLAVINDTIQFGTINGIIHVTEENLEKLMVQYQAKKTEASTLFNLQDYIISALVFIIIVLAIQFIRLRRAKKAAAALPSVDTITTRENILNFIYSNIRNVTIQTICDQFQITPIQLYDILGDDKPGEIIRKHRTSLVRKFRKEKKDEEFIAEHTGFSVSYLKKIF